MENFHETIFYKIENIIKGVEDLPLTEEIGKAFDNAVSELKSLYSSLSNDEEVNVFIEKLCYFTEKNLFRRKPSEELECICYVIIGWIMNHDLSESVQNTILVFCNDNIVDKLCESKYLNDSIVDRILTSRSRHRPSLASNSYLSKKYLLLLAKDPNIYVLQNLLRNTAIDGEIRDEIYKTCSVFLGTNNELVAKDLRFITDKL